MLQKIIIVTLYRPAVYKVHHVIYLDHLNKVALQMRKSGIGDVEGLS